MPDIVRLCVTVALPFRAAFTLGAPGQKPFELDVGARVAYLLRQDDGACRFNADYSGERRCSVYEARPSTCRIYPFTVEVGGVRHQPFNLHCPVPYGAAPQLKRRLQRDATQATEDWERHDNICAAWKRSRTKDRSLNGFLKFALKHLFDDPATRKSTLRLLTDPRPPEQRLVEDVKSRRART